MRNKNGDAGRVVVKCKYSNNDGISMYEYESSLSFEFKNIAPQVVKLEASSLNVPRDFSASYEDRTSSLIKVLDGNNKPLKQAVCHLTNGREPIFYGGSFVVGDFVNLYKVSSDVGTYRIATKYKGERSLDSYNKVIQAKVQCYDYDYRISSDIVTFEMK